MEYDKSLSVCLFFFGGGKGGGRLVFLGGEGGRGEGGLFFLGGGRGEGGTHLLPVSNQSSLHSIGCSSITL